MHNSNHSLQQIKDCIHRSIQKCNTDLITKTHSVYTTPVKYTFMSAKTISNYTIII